ncbi:hypothetical protein GCM10028789_17270 [Sinomonas halotolerans]
MPSSDESKGREEPIAVARKASSGMATTPIPSPSHTESRPLRGSPKGPGGGSGGGDGGGGDRGGGGGGLSGTGMGTH